MTTPNHRPDRGRAARAADLVALLCDQLPLGSPARATVKELQQLFPQRSSEIRDLLERVPGASLAKKGERIGIPKGTVWAIAHGKYMPSPDILAKIKAAAGDQDDQ